MRKIDTEITATTHRMLREIKINVKITQQVKAFSRFWIILFSSPLLTLLHFTVHCTLFEKRYYIVHRPPYFRPEARKHRTRRSDSHSLKALNAHSAGWFATFINFLFLQHRSSDTFDFFFILRHIWIDLNDVTGDHFRIEYSSHLFTDIYTQNDEM